jgi:2-polyprenyl-3-methyl-5-hydroxy-6-metoxy-1,4-benzoquinol methylase
MAGKDFEMEKIDTRLSALYTSDENKLEKYDSWAGEYESDLVNEMDYVAHIDATRIFSEIVTDKSCRILDVACGTGLVGEELRKLGFNNVDGTDFSAEMLKISRDRSVYQNLFQHDFTTALAEPGSYDALLCVGMFSFSVPKITDMIHVIRAVKPGRHCAITVNGAAWRELNLYEQVSVESVKYGFTVEQIIEAGYIQREAIDARVLIIRSPDC